MIGSKFIGLIIIGACISMMISCGSESDFESAEQEIEQYLEINSIAAEKTSSGLYYVITAPGTGDVASSSNLAVANLTGTLLDGSEWINSAFRSLLNNQGVIPGLIEGLLLFSSGAEGQLIIPPSLGFGEEEFNGIPGNSVLLIDIADLTIYEDADAYSDTLLSEYIVDNNLTDSVSQTASGLYYIIDGMGIDSIKPSATSNVRVGYRGYFLDGRQFDANPDATFGLNQVIAGWTEGLQLFGQGASGTLLIPSELAYGAAGNVAIPAHTPILFDIELVQVLD